jgi:AraC-like DNA-binding protein
LDYLGIRFRPGGIFPFIKMPLHVFTNLSVSVNCIDSALGASIQDQLLPLPGWPQRFQQLQALLLRYLRHASYPVVPIGPVVQEIIREKGQISVPQLCSHTNLSQRQLERLFKLYVGISPKLLSRIIRFRHTKNLIKAAHTDSLMGLAFTNGYSDHAHLTKEFKEFSGLTPSAYLAQ